MTASSTTVDRNRPLLIVTIVALLAGGAGWLIGTQIKSPADAAAAAGPPEPSLIAVPVERRVLASSVIFRGDVKFRDATQVAVAGDGAAAALVTAAPPAPGTVVTEGMLLVELSGRPVFALEGELPMFRDLSPGMEGEDVEQLQRALGRLGFDVGVTGLMDDSTERAVRAWYRQAGYPVAGPTAAEQDALAAARARAGGARTELQQAQRALAAAAAPVPESRRLEVEAAVRRAEDALGRTLAGQGGATRAALDAFEEAQSTHKEAADAAREAARRLAAAEAGAHPDSGEAPSPTELRELEAAHQTAIAAVSAAQRAQDDAATELAASDPAVADAATGLAIARAVRDETLASPDLELERAAVTRAREAAATADAALAELVGAIGVTVRRSELVFIPSLPRRVDTVAVARGDEATGPVMTVTGTELVVDAHVSRLDAALLEEGAEARLQEEPAIDLPGRVVFVADQPGTHGVPDGRYHVQLTIDGEAPADELRSVNLRVTVPIETTDGEALVVPLAALSAGADGSARVTVEAADGTTRDVTVEPGLAADGFVAIEPVGEGIDAGDLVVVGTASP